MILGRVVGEVWGARHHPALDGRKLLIIEPWFWYDPSHETGNLVAVDTHGAGLGEDVVVCLGDGARRSLGAENPPIEAAVLGIVDRVRIEADRGPRPLHIVGAAGPGPSVANEPTEATGTTRATAPGELPAHFDIAGRT